MKFSKTFQVICVTVVIWFEAGIPGMVGIASLVLLTFPPNSLCLKLSRQLRGMIAKLTDQRLQFMNELVTGIQVIRVTKENLSNDQHRIQ